MATKAPRARTLTLLGVWIALACAAIAVMAFVEAPPDPPPVNAQDEAIRQRMNEWAVRDAQTWEASDGDLSIPWDQAEGHLAIVIDDVGRELNLFEKLLALRYTLTFSVLPDSVYVAGVQQRLSADSRRPREVILHLPMEPMDPKHMTGVEAGENFLLASDSPTLLQDKVRAAFERVPLARGVNNHMGSRLTTDAAAMATIMALLHERELYFLDSRTTPQTLAAREARRAGVPTLSRKVFLDHEPGREALIAALELAADEARKQPTVVIAHPSAELVEVLSDQLELLHARGIAVYPLSRVLAGS